VRPRPGRRTRRGLSVKNPFPAEEVNRYEDAQSQQIRDTHTRRAQAFTAAKPSASSARRTKSPAAESDRGCSQAGDELPLAGSWTQVFTSADPHDFARTDDRRVEQSSDLPTAAGSPGTLVRSCLRATRRRLKITYARPGHVLSAARTPVTGLLLHLRATRILSGEGDVAVGATQGGHWTTTTKERVSVLIVVALEGPAACHLASVLPSSQQIRVADSSTRTLLEASQPWKSILRSQRSIAQWRQRRGQVILRRGKFADGELGCRGAGMARQKDQREEQKI